MHEMHRIPHITLLELTTRVSRALNGRPEISGQWVVAELSDFKTAAGGHAYGMLVQKSKSGALEAKIQARIWRNNLLHLNHKFKESTGSPIQNDMKLLLYVTVSHHPLYGIGADITDIDPSYTLGDVERQRREILEHLEKLGILHANKELPLPPAPQKIAVVSAAGAAGYGDFMHQLHDSGFAFYPALFQATMQGANTAPTVMAALDRIEQSVDFWDCVVIIRGGGATADMNAFDNAELARRVATFPLPVIVGIGHERDNCVLDYIAHTRCKTPTAVAAFLIDSLAIAETRALDATRWITDHVREALANESMRLANAENLLRLLPLRLTDSHSHRLQSLQSSLQLAASARVAEANRSLSLLSAKITAAPTARCASEYARIDALMKCLAPAAGNCLQRANDNLLRIKALLDVLSPEATLKRGYTITSAHGRALRSADDARCLPPGTEITTRFPDGSWTTTL